MKRQPEIIIDGVVWYLYTATYSYGDGEYSIEFYALSPEDAQRRINAIKDFLTYEGRVCEQVISKKPYDDLNMN